MILLRHNILLRLFFALFIVTSFFVPRIEAKGCCGGCRGGGARSGGFSHSRTVFMRRQSHSSSSLEQNGDVHWGFLILCMPVGVIVGWSKLRKLLAFDCDTECTCECELTCCRPLYWWDLLVMIAVQAFILMLIGNRVATVMTIIIFGGWLFLKIIGFWEEFWAKK